MNKLNIAYSCNEAYIQHTGISMLSLFENNRDFEKIDVYFIAKDVSDKSILLLQELTEQYQRKLIIIPFEKLCSRLKINNLGRHIETVYAKLFFSQIKEVDKMLYIDSDTIINDSLSTLWNIDISEYLIAGVETFTVRAKKELGLYIKDNFINDGVVLLNLEQFRKQSIEDEFIKKIADFNGNPPILSEGIINLVCNGKILSLHPKYNLLSGFFEYEKHNIKKIEGYYSSQIISEAINNPVIIHYLSALYNRPWNTYCTHPLKERYLYYKSLSTWKDNSLKKDKLNFRLRIIRLLFRFLPLSLLKLIISIKRR